MTEWIVQLGLWLARWGGWTLPPGPEPITITVIQPDPLIVAQRDDLVAEVKTLQSVLRVKEMKIQMREVKLHEAEDRLAALEKDLVIARAGVGRSFAPSLTDAQFARIRQLVTEADGQSMSGEAKRHAVYARLLKEFPQSSKRELALAIEVALIKSVEST